MTINSNNTSDINTALLYVQSKIKSLSGSQSDYLTSNDTSLLELKKMLEGEDCDVINTFAYGTAKKIYCKRFGNLITFQYNLLGSAATSYSEDMIVGTHNLASLGTIDYDTTDSNVPFFATANGIGSGRHLGRFEFNNDGNIYFYWQESGSLSVAYTVTNFYGLQGTIAVS